jgi:hypothetical protein
MDKVVGIQNKNKEETRNTYTQLAISDTKHDFNKYIYSGSPYVKEILKYLPTSMKEESIDYIDEYETLDRLLNIDIVKIYKEIIDTDKILNTSVLNFNYKIKCVNKDDIRNSEDMYNFLQIKNVVDNNFSFLIDTDKFSLYNTLLNKKYNKDVNFYFIVNRERACDSGTKKSFKEHKNVTYKNNITIIRDKESNYKIYTKYDPDETNIMNDFFSNFNIKLGPLDNLSYEIDNIIIDNIKKDNSINGAIYILYSIKKRNIKDNKDIVYPFIQKRSGDWLQALSLLQQSRVYEPNKIKGVPILVTFDRLLLGYALSIGVNVLFEKLESSSSKKSYMYFYNDTEVSSTVKLREMETYLQSKEKEFRQYLEYKDILVKAYDYQIRQINEMLEFLLNQMNRNNFNGTPTDLQNLYFQFNLKLIFKIIFNKKFLYYVKYFHNINLNSSDIYTLQNFEIQTRYFMDKYNKEGDIINSIISDIDSDCYKFVGESNLKYLRFLYTSEITTSESQINIIAIYNYYKFIMDNEKEYYDKLTHIIASYANISNFVTGIYGDSKLFQAIVYTIISVKNKQYNIHDANSNNSNNVNMNQSGGRNSTKTSLKIRNNKKNLFNTTRKINHNKINHNTIKTVELSILYLEKQYTDKEFYKSTNCIIIYKDKNRKEQFINYYINTVYYTFEYLKKYFSINSNRIHHIKEFNRFINCILLSLHLDKDKEVLEYLDNSSINEKYEGSDNELEEKIEQIQNTLMINDD